MKNKTLRVLGLLGFSALVAGILLTHPTKALSNTNDVTICHATSSNSNPYVVHTPAKSADVSGHDGHNGPVWYDGIAVDWGDIIPPFDYDASSYPGKNWTTEGQAFYNNECNIPSGGPTGASGPTGSSGATGSSGPTGATGAEPTATPTPTQSTNVGGPGDGLSDGRSDGLSSCPECTKAPTGQVLGATTEFAGTGVASDMIMNVVGALGGISTASGLVLAAKKKFNK